MEIFDYFINEKRSWIDKIRACDWRAAKFLADLLEQNKFHNVLGNGSLFIMADGEKLVSFCTLTHRDCIKDDSLFPWVGFVFTAPYYRRFSAVSAYSLTDTLPRINDSQSQ